MRVISVLAGVFLGTLGASSVARSATIDFGFVVFSGPITYTGATLQGSTTLGFGGAMLEVSQVGATDGSGLALGDRITISRTVDDGPGKGRLKTNIVTSWSDALGSFTETLTTLAGITRGTNEILLVFDGSITSAPASSGLAGAPVVLDLALNQAGGPGNVVSASFTTASSAIPEPSTWVMLALGCGGLAYAALRRSVKDRSAVAI
jgi:hypothetical protein